MLSGRWIKHLPKLIGVGIVIGVGLGVTWLISNFMDAKPSVTKKSVQQITLLKPPPPSPKVDKPPEPKVKREEIDMPEPEMAEEMPEIADEVPAGDQLGVDAEGGAGGDNFGLIGKKGGRSFLSGSGDPFVMFASQLQRLIEDALLESDKTRKKAYSVIARIWVSDDGGILQTELVSSTGAQDIDQSLVDAINKLTVINGRIPEGMPQPIKLRITSRL